MSDIVITVEGADQMMIKSAKFIPAVNGALMAGGIHVRGKLAIYPAQSHITRKEVYGTSFKSDKQRKWFFAVGIHQTPYNRTKQLGNEWTISNPMPLQVNVGNVMPYGPYVQGSPGQSLYHKAQGWKDTDTVASEETAYVGRQVKKAIDAL